VARAMATKPGLLLFDDPTTGLDPITATTVDDEVVKLRDLEQVTTVVATHQIRDAFYVATHKATRSADGAQVTSTTESDNTHAEFMVLHEGRIHFQGDAAELLACEDAYIKEFLYKTLPPW
jgi:phospholipid/cholesterol/gamma-HCH transport system ATP-binding protein